MKILAVDDERVQLRLLERSIREAAPGCVLYASDNPADALRWAEKNRPEVAFCDIQMPVMNGIALGKALKKLDAQINLVFVTGYYEEYAAEAAPLRYSGYLQKPATAEGVRSELADLRYPVAKPEGQKLLTVRCFGNFEVFAGGEPVNFQRSKTKELFAYLVDRRGAQVNGSEICAALYEDGRNEKNNKSDLRKSVADLRQTLEGLHAEAVFRKGFDRYSVDVSLLQCDYYDWMQNEAYAVRAFRGEYMRQYSWSEVTLTNIIKYE